MLDTIIYFFFNKKKNLLNKFSEYSNAFKDFLSTLSVTELCLIFNVCISLFIFGCLITIISSFYGNILLDKFNLEAKYPKIAKFINIRQKLNHFYVISNTIYILVALIAIVLVNLITFLSIY